jgi:glyoxylase-like metal-dependent hydrolase (beta-lactamase superfamily II)
MTRPAIVCALIILGGIATQVGSQEPAKVVRMQTLNVSDNLYLLSGGGGNTLALATDDGVVLIDTKLAGWGRPILESLAAVTDKPVTMIINTHTHGDHTGSNPEFPSAVQIIAHDNTKANMQKMAAFKDANARFLPNRTFQDRLSLLDGIDQIDLYYFGAGHTNGDVVVVFPAKRVAHMGDLFPSKSAPLIDTANGGSAVAYPTTLSKAVATLDGVVTRVVTGHGAVPPGSPIRNLTTLDDLKEYADFNRDFLAAVREAAAAGKTSDAAASSLALPARYKDYAMDRAKDDVAIIYREIK